MRKTIRLMDDWQFTGPDGSTSDVTLPHTWNNLDGQDGGNDYWRGTCTYKTTFPAPVYTQDYETVWLQFDGVNSSAVVTLNGAEICRHDGGYSTFRADITTYLQPVNQLTVSVDNGRNDVVYPQKADFTFYGGIYRDVTLLIANRSHIALGAEGGSGIQITPHVEGASPETASIHIETDVEYASGDEEHAEVMIEIRDVSGAIVLTGTGSDATLTLPHPHLWDGVADPYLYSCSVRLVVGGMTVDEVVQRFGCRSFAVDGKTGFSLNGRPYPLHGVSRHQDRKGIGNAISREMHKEDMEIIREMGANTIRLAHYQHDQYFYDLCDEAGMIVWAEIPYISEHMPQGRENTISQMRELITQNYNHPSIVCWGVSNEITISTKDHKDMLDNHHVLNDLCHEMDPSRLTTLACYAMCGPFNKVAHITDLVSWNLYLGWYVPGLFLNDLWINMFHLFYPHRPLGFSEYGAEAMTNLHSERPRIGDHSEEYQAVYHEFMLECFARHPWMWATHVWNMFDFAADARDQGGEPGMNHKGLVTFDRKVRKDSYYLYKAWWSDRPFVHICSKRFVERAVDQITVKVYSNQPAVTLYVDGREVGTQHGEHVFTFKVPVQGTIQVRAVAGDYADEAAFIRVARPNASYRLDRSKGKGANWV